ncbi:MAG: hypothetical protein WCG27_13445, partial [Pseudomonadota bacterium]
MERDYLYNYDRGIEALEDLGKLAGHDLAPVVGRAYHYFAEMKRKTYENLERPAADSPIRHFLEKSIRQILHDFLLNEKNITQLNLSFDSEALSMEQWNKVLDGLPSFLTIIRLLPYKGVAAMQLNAQGITFAAPVADEENLDKNRTEIYAHLRQILKKQALLTFQLKEDSILELFLDLGHNLNTIYMVKLGMPPTFRLGFSCTFPSYRLVGARLGDFGRHFCLEINPHGILRRYEKIPEHFEEELKAKE